MRTLLLLLLACKAIHCGGVSSERILVVPGQTRSEAEVALSKSQYCLGTAATHKQQRYGRCDVTGFETGESWVVVDYSKRDKVARVRRMERFGSHGEAVKRWNSLWEGRARRLGKTSMQARSELGHLGEAPVGAIAWKVWYGPDKSHLIGIYLVKPEDTSSAQVVEVLRLVTPK